MSTRPFHMPRTASPVFCISSCGSSIPYEKSGELRPLIKRTLLAVKGLFALMVFADHAVVSVAKSVMPIGLA